MLAKRRRTFVAGTFARARGRGKGEGAAGDRDRALESPFLVLVSGLLFLLFVFVLWGRGGGHDGDPWFITRSL